MEPWSRSPRGWREAAGATSSECASEAIQEYHPLCVKRGQVRGLVVQASEPNGRYLFEPWASARGRDATKSQSRGAATRPLAELRTHARKPGTFAPGSVLDKTLRFVITNSPPQLVCHHEPALAGEGSAFPTTGGGAILLRSKRVG